MPPAIRDEFAMSWALVALGQQLLSAAAEDIEP